MRTQALIANMVGVRREGVAEAALSLQEAGLVRYKRGRIAVLDRHGLERRTCECYGGGQEGTRAPASGLNGSLVSARLPSRCVRQQTVQSMRRAPHW